jgi:long-chain acyl-CoA synthetase
LADWSEDLIPVERARTLDGLFYQRVKRSPDRIAYRWFARADGAWHAITWRETARQVARWRDALRAEGLSPGDRVAILLRNCPEWVICRSGRAVAGAGHGAAVHRRPRRQCRLHPARCRRQAAGDPGRHRWNRLAEVIGEQPWPRRVVLMERADASTARCRRGPAGGGCRDWLPESGADWEQREADPGAWPPSSTPPAPPGGPRA